MQLLLLPLFPGKSFKQLRAPNDLFRLNARCTRVAVGPFFISRPCERWNLPIFQFPIDRGLERTGGILPAIYSRRGFFRAGDGCACDTDGEIGRASFLGREKKKKMT